LHGLRTYLSHLGRLGCDWCICRALSRSADGTFVQICEIVGVAFYAGQAVTHLPAFRLFRLRFDFRHAFYLYPSKAPWHETLLNRFLPHNGGKVLRIECVGTCPLQRNSTMQLSWLFPSRAVLFVSQYPPHALLEDQVVLERKRASGGHHFGPAERV